MKNLESSSESSLICRFDNHSIIQKASERDGERANEALETRHDTTLKCGSSITIAVPKVALIPVRHSRKRPKRMQDGMRKLCLEGRSSLVLSVSRSSYWPSAPAVGSPSYDYDKWPAAGWAYFTMCWKIEWSDNEVLLISTGDLFSDKQWTKPQQNYANFVPDIDDESLTLFLGVLTRFRVFWI